MRGHKRGAGGGGRQVFGLDCKVDYVIPLAFNLSFGVWSIERGASCSSWKGVGVDHDARESRGRESGSKA